MILTLLFRKPSNSIRNSPPLFTDFWALAKSRGMMAQRPRTPLCSTIAPSGLLLVKKIVLTLFLVRYLSSFVSSAQKESQGDGAQVVDIEAFGRLVRWFGPFRNKQGEETILDRMRLTCSLP